MQAELEKLRAILAGRRIPEAREAMEGLAGSLGHIDEQQQLILAASGSSGAAAGHRRGGRDRGVPGHRPARCSTGRASRSRWSARRRR